jgi:hypothetical protein
MYMTNAMLMIEMKQHMQAEGYKQNIEQNNW